MGILVTFQRTGPYSMAGEGILFGIVHDNQGNPLQGVRVTTSWMTQGVLTNSEGLFIYGHIAGLFVGYAEKDGYESQETSGQDIEVSDANFTFLDITMGEAYDDVGTVVFGQVKQETNAARTARRFGSCVEVNPKWDGCLLADARVEVDIGLEDYITLHCIMNSPDYIAGEGHWRGRLPAGTGYKFRAVVGSGPAIQEGAWSAPIDCSASQDHKSIVVPHLPYEGEPY